MNTGKPDVRELVGVAVSASRLVMTPNRNEGHLVRVAALGGAANRIALNLDAQQPVRLRSGATVMPQLVAGVPRASNTSRALAGTRAPGERDELEARLAPLLWRMKFGGDGTHETALDALRLFARWLAGTVTWQQCPVPHDLAQRFAARVIFEWLADTCPACGGTGLQELLRSGMTRKPKRFGDPAVRHVHCRACRGSRRPRPNPMDRARALELSLADYRSHWALRMDRAGMQLACIARRLKKPLHSELERR